MLNSAPCFSLPCSVGWVRPYGCSLPQLDSFLSAALSLFSGVTVTGSCVQASRAVWAPPPHILNSTVRKQTQMSGSLVIILQVARIFFAGARWMLFLWCHPSDCRISTVPWLKQHSWGGRNPTATPHLNSEDSEKKLRVGCSPDSEHDLQRDHHSRREGWRLNCRIRAQIQSRCCILLHLMLPLRGIKTDGWDEDSFIV